MFSSVSVCVYLSGYCLNVLRLEIECGLFLVKMGAARVLRSSRLCPQPVTSLGARAVYLCVVVLFPFALLHSITLITSTIRSIVHRHDVLHNERATSAAHATRTHPRSQYTYLHSPIHRGPTPYTHAPLAHQHRYTRRTVLHASMVARRVHVRAKERMAHSYVDHGALHGTA